MTGKHGAVRFPFAAGLPEQGFGGLLGKNCVQAGEPGAVLQVRAEVCRGRC